MLQCLVFGPADWLLGLSLSHAGTRIVPPPVISIKEDNGLDVHIDSSSPTWDAQEGRVITKRRCCDVACFSLGV